MAFCSLRDLKTPGTLALNRDNISCNQKNLHIIHSFFDLICISFHQVVVQHSDEVRQFLKVSVILISVAPWQRVFFLGAFAKLRKAMLASSCLSVWLARWLTGCPRGTTRIPLDGFSWNLIFDDFSKIYREKLLLRDFRFTPRCRWYLRSSGILRCVEWSFWTDVSGQPIRPIFTCLLDNWSWVR
jgi:hypothetical protein